MAVLLFGDRGALPAPLAGLVARRVDHPADVDDAIGPFRRVVVVGVDGDLSTVLTRLLRANRLDVEVGYCPPRRTTATRVYGLPSGRRAARRARDGSALRVPLIRDETGSAVVGAASWLPADGKPTLQGEVVVDDTMLFDGDVAGVRIEPTAAMPGLRAAVLTGRGRPGRWIPGRAAQLGTTGAVVVRDAVPAAKPVRRSTFYRNIEGWLLVQ